MTETLVVQKKVVPLRRFEHLYIVLELAKARLTALVVVTAFVGFLLAPYNSVDWLTLFWTLLGTALAAGGANAWNQWWEAPLDASMTRTKSRPLPSGKINHNYAFFCAAGLSISGIGILLHFVNLITAALGLAVIALYIFIYTPLKTRSSLCTLAGAVCGAIPPMMGWTAATGGLNYGAWVLGAILFVWQIPHFLSLAWLYKKDYARGGFQMLPLMDQKGGITFPLIVIYSLALMPLGLTVTLAGLSGWIYAAGSILLGFVLTTLGVVLSSHRRDKDARRLFLATIIYLPILLGLMIADKGTIYQSPQSYITTHSNIYSVVDDNPMKTNEESSIFYSDKSKTSLTVPARSEKL